MRRGWCRWFVVSAWVWLLVAHAHALLADEKNTIQVYRAMAPRVVNVDNMRPVMTLNFDVFNVPVGVGTGFLWDDRGYVVTNLHVIREASKVVVNIAAGRRYPATLVGADPHKDIAVLKIDLRGHAIPGVKGPIPLADSNTLQVGQKTIAIGNPFGLDKTITTGIISALGRKIQTGREVSIRDVIQTDASINPGNSGGPLLDSAGRLIGVNTMIYSSSGASNGIGFAVSANQVKKIVEQLIQHRRLIQAGIGIERFSDAFAAQLGVDGVIIKAIVPQSPAAKSGLKPAYLDQYGRFQLGDVIVGLNGHPIKDYDNLYRLLEKVAVGDRVTLTIQRAGKRVDVPITTIDIYAER